MATTKFEVAMPIGPIGSNGHQKYKNWDTMMGSIPARKVPGLKASNGVYELNDEFY